MGENSTKLVLKFCIVVGRGFQADFDEQLWRGSPTCSTLLVQLLGIVPLDEADSCMSEEPFSGLNSLSPQPSERPGFPRLYFVSESDLRIWGTDGVPKVCGRPCAQDEDFTIHTRPHNSVEGASAYRVSRERQRCQRKQD